MWGTSNLGFDSAQFLVSTNPFSTLDFAVKFGVLIVAPSVISIFVTIPATAVVMNFPISFTFYVLLPTCISRE